jgi:hypothetical protein
MDARERTPSDARESAPDAAPKSRPDAGLEQVAARGAFPPGVSPSTVLALQRKAGNRAVGSLARSTAKQQIQRVYADDSGRLVAGGNLRGGAFAANIVGLGEHVINVVPWTSPDGTNNNFLDLGGYQRNAQRLPPLP